MFKRNEVKSQFSTRSVPFEQVNTSSNGDGLTFEGYAAVFNSPTLIDDMWEGTFEEKISEGAFRDTIAAGGQVFQFDHGRHPLVGSIPLGTITKLEEDSRGLFVQARLSDNWLVQPVRDAIAAGAIDGMSFRFSVPDGGDMWTEVKGQLPSRTLTKLDVAELGPVVFPAYSDTTAKVRSMLGLSVEENDRLKDAGLLDTRSDGGSDTDSGLVLVNKNRHNLLRMKGIV